MSAKTLVIGIGVLAVGLMVWGNSRAPVLVMWDEESQVACLPNGHENIALHIHPHISIAVDGFDEVVPANIGIRDGCMAEVHTHDQTGEIHVETIVKERALLFSLQDFFDVWGVGLEREGYEAQILHNGEQRARLHDVPLQDGDRIEIQYTTISKTEAQ